MFPGGGGLFGMMDQMMNDMMRMNQALMTDPYLQGVPMGQQQQQMPHSNPVVEEVASDAQHQQRAPHATGPIVEEPDEDPNIDEEGYAQQHSHNQPQVPQHYTAARAPQPAVPPVAHPMNNMVGMPLLSPFGGLFDSMLGGHGLGTGMNIQSSGTGGGQVYSYSSSQVFSSGPNGVYQSSSTTRQGPGGVRESQRTIRDGRSGHESMTIARGIGDKERVVSRTRDATGQMHTSERNVGLDPNSVHDFDQEWVQHAQQTMPNWMNSGIQQQRSLAGAGHRQQQQLALPPGAGAGGVQYQQQQQQQGGVYSGQQYQQQRGVRHHYGGGGGGGPAAPMRPQTGGGSGNGWPGSYQV